ncbi:RNA polymerase II transcriptional coactivator KELP [Acorus gramineus]|uniref:RNA polymerase II transcriptional coactivator KELP n=1 Tax=Acorus gramineus TaxID=55184 RepID=A0AAV9A606_ACOGR|nr:RNA polymerase II transcriptional coactivator KELP [Acorus gramineus]
MEAEEQRRIEEAVLEILKGADMEESTEYKIRSAAAERLDLDLSLPDRKRFVRKIVESFLLSQKEDDDDGGKVEGEAKEEPEEEEEEDKRGDEEREYDQDGNLIICRLSKKRKVTIQDFKGKTLVSIREYYDKNGKELPSTKGMSLTAEQWTTFSKAVPAVEEAIKKLESEMGRRSN